jgi:Zn-dependent metalloprotease
MFRALPDGTVPAAPDDSSQTGTRPMTTSEKIKAKRLSIQLNVETDVATAVHAYVNRKWIGTDNEARVERADKDDLGYTHVRMKQYYKGIPVDGTDMIVHVNGENAVYWITGGMAERLNVDVRPQITVGEAERIAIDDALRHKCVDENCSSWKSTDSMLPRLSFDLERQAELEIRVAGEPFLMIYGSSGLAYRVLVREAIKDLADWEYWVDAHSGRVVAKDNLLVYFTHPPSSQGYDTTITGVKANHEVRSGSTDSTTSFVGWKDTVDSHHYFLYYKGHVDSSKAPWAIFDLHDSDHVADTSKDSLVQWAQKGVGDWGTSDKAAISLARNAALVTNWMRDTLGLYGIDRNGKRLWVNAHYRINFTNAAFSGTDTMTYFGDGDDSTFYAWCTIENVGHEVGHALSFHTSQLHGGSLPGGLSESYADIMAASVEFANEPDSTSKYPYSARGCADWLGGEDMVIGKAALRDFRLPQRIEKGGSWSDLTSTWATLYDGPRFWIDLSGSYKWDQHSMMGVQCFAFYLLSEGNSDSVRHNEGYAYGVFEGVGVSRAARIAMRANVDYLTKYSTFQDSKNAWLLAAQDLIDSGLVPSYATAAVESCWSAVDLEPELRLSYINKPGLQIGRNGNLKTHGATGVGAGSGLKVTHAGTGSGLTVVADTMTVRYTDSLGTVPSFLDDADSLLGCLVVRAPDGLAHMCVDSLGHIRVRDTVRRAAFRSPFFPE